ncbi:hypothetical protein AX15_005807 [Amanita polypyramis BW_CC]|nr:hypothetical protein AX15_005807 [Amanita polypyramis BW_CC]
MVLNKLKKKSRTLAYAETEGPIYDPKPALNTAILQSTPCQGHKTVQCSTVQTSHYAGETVHEMITTVYAKGHGSQMYSESWAVRALNAETKLTAKEKELALLSLQRQERHANLERLVYILLAIITALIFVIIYQANLYIRHHNDAKRGNRWSTPAHFTIPILSPFTSVVEHETSVVNSKTVVVLFCVAGCVVYMAFRHWISRR